VNGLPELLATSEAEGRVELELDVPADCPWFDGHFARMPILPGVIQVGWAVHYAHTLFGFGPGVTGLEQVKFRRPVGPGTHLTLILKPDPARRRVRYEYRAGEQSCSSGVLEFGEQA
jgi:3-hydroxymyristoyl/3-hydroxydecanoyl-(acyl carrier protein) dehydratase